MHRNEPVKKRTDRRAYLVFSRSKTAQRIMKAITESDGITTSDLIGKTRQIGVAQYVNTLEADGMIVCRMMPVAHAPQLVKHFWAVP